MKKIILLFFILTSFSYAITELELKECDEMKLNKDMTFYLCDEKKYLIKYIKNTKTNLKEKKIISVNNKM